MTLNQSEVDRLVDRHLERLYEDLERQRLADQPPSEIFDMLNKNGLGDLADGWREYWETDDEEEWT